MPLIINLMTKTLLLATMIGVVCGSWILEKFHVQFVGRGCVAVRTFSKFVSKKVDQRMVRYKTKEGWMSVDEESWSGVVLLHNAVKWVVEEDNE